MMKEMQAPSTKPLLEAGDHLSREEFHRRYALRPDIARAELIVGVVYVPSPVRAREHGVPHHTLAGWLALYQVEHPELEVAHDTTYRPPVPDSEVQPDIAAWRIGGAAFIDADGYLAGTPDLIVEITASSASYDLHVKKALYARAGVPEYIAWRTVDGELDWFLLEDGSYRRQEPDEAGRLHSRVFPGLRLHLPGLLAGARPAALFA